MPKLVSVIKLGLKVDDRVVPVVVKIHHVANDDSGEQVCNRHPATSETQLNDTRVTCNRASWTASIAVLDGFTSCTRCSCT